MENYFNEVNLESEVLAYFLIDENNTLIKNTQLESKHFFDEEKRLIFKIFKKKYNDSGILNYKEIVKDYENDDRIKKAIFEIYKYACYYVIVSDVEEFKKNEKRLLDRYRDKEIKDLITDFQNKKIDLNTFRSRLDVEECENEIKNLLDISDDIENYSKDNPKKRAYTEIRGLDVLLKGLEYGYVYLWTGHTNSGKTVLMTQITNSILKSGQKCFYFSGEQTSNEFKNGLYVNLCPKEELEFVKDKNNEYIIDIIPKQDALIRLNKLLRNRLYVYNNDIPHNDIKTMIEVMKEAFKLGVNVFFIDNFMQLDDSEMLEQQTKIMEQFKRFARNNNVIVNLVAHPRKTQFSSSRLNIMDISGSQNIANKASSIITITRTDMINESEKKNIKDHLAKYGYLLEKCDAFLEVLKTKGTRNGIVGLSYEKETKMYVEIPKMSKSEYEYSQKTIKVGRS